MRPAPIPGNLEGKIMDKCTLSIIDINSIPHTLKQNARSNRSAHSAKTSAILPLPLNSRKAYANSSDDFCDFIKSSKAMSKSFDYIPEASSTPIPRPRCYRKSNDLLDNIFSGAIFALFFLFLVFFL